MNKNVGATSLSLFQVICILSCYVWSLAWWHCFFFSISLNFCTPFAALVFFYVILFETIFPGTIRLSKQLSFYHGPHRQAGHGHGTAIYGGTQSAGVCKCSREENISRDARGGHGMKHSCACSLSKGIVTHLINVYIQLWIFLWLGGILPTIMVCLRPFPEGSPVHCPLPPPPVCTMTPASPPGEADVPRTLLGHQRHISLNWNIYSCNIKALTLSIPQAVH